MECETAQSHEQVGAEPQRAASGPHVEHLLQNYYAPRKIALRGCQPRDLLDQVLSLAEYLGEPARLTPELLDSACAGYFVDERESPVVYA